MKKTCAYLLPWIVVGLFAEVGVAAAGGTITGKASYHGKFRNRMIMMGADPKCKEMHTEKIYQEVIAVGEGGAVRNVFVHVQGATGPTPDEKVVLDQKTCIYHPRVMGAVAGQTLEVRNSDPTLHNIHAWSEEENSFNLAQPLQGSVDEFVLENEEVMLKIKCDVHPWMIGYIGIVTHPYFAVTGDDGSFAIDGVPPGTYVLEAWQERLGAITREVQVKEGETAAVDFEFTGPTKKASILPIRELEPHAHPAGSRPVIGETR